MAAVAVVTDSGCDLDPEVAKAAGVEVVPLHVRFDSKDFLDQVELSREEFWARCEAGRDLPSTAAPSTGAFQEAFLRSAEAGASAAVCVSLASALSATHQAALAAAEAVRSSIEVVVVDSGSASLAQGLCVLEASRAAGEGADLAAVVDLARSAASRCRLFGTLATLDYLKRGGRIGAVKALVGQVLSFKPVIELRDGEVRLVGRARTRGRAMTATFDAVAACGKLDRVAIVHSGAADLSQVMAAVEERGWGEPMVAVFGPTVGTHVGPGAIALAALVAG